MSQRVLKVLSFWSINAPLDPSALTTQLEELQRAGLDGVVFHPRFYPNEPMYLSKAYMDQVSSVILHAKRLGLEFWLYDENGWPSGSAGGQVIKLHPSLRTYWLDVIAEDRELPPGAAVLRSFERDQVTYRIVRCESRKPSTLDPAATAAFITLTHEAYASMLDLEAFEYVTGFFSDEAGFDQPSEHGGFGTVPWTMDAADIYRERYGEDLLQHADLLFVQGTNADQVRQRYWELMSDLLADRYYRPLQAWATRHRKMMTAHLKGEEHPLFQVRHSGSCLNVLRTLSVPAIDALERFPGNSYYPKTASSLAKQFGTGECLVEAFGGSGWGAEPEDLERYMLWLADNGYDRIVLHLNQYELKSQAVRDWPPSLPLHVSWKGAFPSLLDRVREKASEVLDAGETELLVVTPARAVMAAITPVEAYEMNEHDGSGYPLTEAGRINDRFMQLIAALDREGIRFDLTEERILEQQGEFSQGNLRLGKQVYRSVVIPRDCAWKNDTILYELNHAGVTLLTDQDGALFTYREQSEWGAAIPPGNRLLLEGERTEDGRFCSFFRMEGVHGNLTLLVLDRVGAVRVNGVRMQAEAGSNQGYSYEFTAAECLHANGLNRIEFELLPDGEQAPIHYITGPFRVVSDSVYLPRNSRELMTHGPFRLLPTDTAPDPQRLVESGYPFMLDSIECRKSIRLRSEDRGKTLRLGEVFASAAELWLDDVELGWCWGPDWRTTLPMNLEDGHYLLTMRLYPSTMNAYGPHHHVDGDLPVVSPGQYEGIKNFADRPDAPADTRIEGWNFKRFGISGSAYVPD